MTGQKLHLSTAQLLGNLLHALLVLHDPFVDLRRQPQTTATLVSGPVPSSPDHVLDRVRRALSVPDALRGLERLVNGLGQLFLGGDEVPRVHVEGVQPVQALLVLHGLPRLVGLPTGGVDGLLFLGRQVVHLLGSHRARHRGVGEPLVLALGLGHQPRVLSLALLTPPGDLAVDVDLPGVQFLETLPELGLAELRHPLFVFSHLREVVGRWDILG